MDCNPLSDVIENSDVSLRSAHISREVKQLLLDFFAASNAFQLWNHKIRNQKFKALLKQGDFLHLNRSQIKRVYDLYSSTVTLKQFIATSIVKKTDEMINNDAKSISMDSMISILGNCYFQFSLNEEFNGLPDKLRNFLFINYNASNSYAEGIWNNIDEQTVLYNTTLVRYYNRVLLKLYKNYWQALAAVESGEMKLTGVNLSIFINQLEYNLKLKRDIDSKDSESEMRKLFLNRTCMQALLTEINDEDMYKSVNEKNVILYPAYVELIYKHGCRDDLYHIFFQVFENACYDYYATSVAMMKIKDTDDEITSGDESNDTDEENKDFSCIQMKSLYFICGAAFRSMLGINVAKDVQTVLLSNLTISLSQALEMKLPCAKIEDEAKIRDNSTNEIQLICVNKEIFECVVAIEREVLIPVFGNLQLLAAVGNRFYSFIKAQFRSHNSFTLLEDTFYKVVKVNTNITIKADTLVNALLDKFEDYYLHTRFNDFIIAQLPRVNKVLSGRSNSMFENIGFRDKIKVGAIDDNRK